MSIYQKFPELNEAFHALSFGYDRFGVEYISMAEHRHYPFYGFQFHPEKTFAIWSPKAHTPHQRAARKMS